MSRLRKNPIGKALAFAAVLLLLVVGQSLATDDKKDKTVKGRIEILEARVEELENLLVHFSRSGNDITIAGANLHVVNGTGTTDGTPNGLGNVIIGYNEPRTTRNDRSGSHVLVVGSNHNYSSYGGIVAGYGNTARGYYASVSGGSGNQASGEYASVCGGQGNDAGGSYTSISGGLDNRTYWHHTWVGGGRGNSAGLAVVYPRLHWGDYASVSGGRGNEAGGDGASITGGEQNIAIGTYASVSGGSGTTATEEGEHPDTHPD